MEEQYYEEQDLKTDSTDNPKQIVSKSKMKGTIVAILTVVVLTLLTFLCIMVVVPSVAYNNGVKAYEMQDYQQAMHFFNKAGTYKDANKQAGIASRSYEYQLGMEAFSREEYDNAVEHFSAAVDQFDAPSKLLESELGVHYKTADEYFDSCQYVEATKEYILSGHKEKIKDCIIAAANSDNPDDMIDFCLEQLSDEADSELMPYISYLTAASLAKKGDYSNAISLLNDIQEGVPEQASLLESLYIPYAEQLIANGEYASAKKYYKLAGSSEEIFTELDFRIAEQYYREGELNTAKTMYLGLPEDYRLGDISVTERLSQLEQYASFVELCGKYRIVSGKIETRETHISTGLWDSWYQEYGSTYQYLTIRCVIESDGTVTIKGTANYYRYTNYSDYSSKLNVESRSYTFSKNVKSIPSKLVDTSTITIKYSKGTFSFKAKFVDSTNINFRYTYTSEFKYKKT